MGDVVGHLLQALHQRLDALEHGVEVFGEAIELVAAAPDRQPPSEVTRHDALGGAGHGINPLQHPPRDENAADDAEHDDDQHRPLCRLRDDDEHATPLVEVAPDQEAKAAGQLDDAHQRAMVGPVLVLEPTVGGLGPAFGCNHARRERADIARDRDASRRRHEIEVGAGPQRAALDVEDQPVQTAAVVGVGDLADFRIDRGGDLLGDQAAGVPGEIADERGSKQRKQKQIKQRQPKRSGSDQFTECRHGSCTYFEHFVCHQ
jgi:hypothetical protein